MSTPADEAAAKLIRLLNTIVAPMGKRLGAQHEDAVREICQLLSIDGALAPLDDLPSAPRVSPAEAAASNYVPAEQVDPNYREWKERKERKEQERM